MPTKKIKPLLLSIVILLYKEREKIYKTFKIFDPGHNISSVGNARSTLVIVRTMP